MLSRLWVKQAATCPDGPSPVAGEGNGVGADAPAAPYKHRLAYAPGGQRPSGRAFRCVGVLGFTPSRFWALLAIQKCHPGGSRTGFAPCKINATPIGEMKLYTVNPSVSRSAATFPYSWEALGVRRTYYALAKGSAPSPGDHKPAPKIS